MGASGFPSTARNQLWANVCLIHFPLTQGTSVDFKIEFTNPISGLQFWIVAKVCILWLFMYIPSSDVISGLRQRFTCSRCANQEYSRKFGILQTTFEPPWSYRCWCWDDSRILQGHHWGNQLLPGMFTHHLTWNSSFLQLKQWSIALTMYTKSATFFFDENNTIDQFCSIFKLRKNLVRQCKTSQRAWVP